MKYKHLAVSATCIRNPSWGAEYGRAGAAAARIGDARKAAGRTRTPDSAAGAGRALSLEELALKKDKPPKSALALQIVAALCD